MPTQPDHASPYPENVLIVGSLADLFDAVLSHEKNVALLRRDLNGDYAAITQGVLDRHRSAPELRYKNYGRIKPDYAHEDMPISRFFRDANLAAQTPAGRAALETIRADIEIFREHGFKPMIRVQRRNIVGSAHIDGAGNAKMMDRLLVNYHGASTRGWRPDDVVLAPGGGVPAQIKPEAKSFDMHLGDIWRHAAAHNKASRPFLHSVPVGNTQPRLLIVADPKASPDY